MEGGSTRLGWKVRLLFLKRNTEGSLLRELAAAGGLKE